MTNEIKEVSPGDFEKLKLIQDVPINEILKFVIERRERLNWANLSEIEKNRTTVTPIDIKNRIGELLSSVVEDNDIFIIKRKSKYLADLRPFRQTLDDSIDTITSQELAKNRKILDMVHGGKKFGVIRHGKIVAVLGSAAGYPYKSSSKEKIEKLELLDGISSDELRKALIIIKGCISLSDLLK